MQRNHFCCEHDWPRFCLRYSREAVYEKWTSAQTFFSFIFIFCVPEKNERKTLGSGFCEFFYATAKMGETRERANVMVVAGETVECRRCLAASITNTWKASEKLQKLNFYCSAIAQRNIDIFDKILKLFLHFYIWKINFAIKSIERALKYINEWKICEKIRD